MRKILYLIISILIFGCTYQQDAPNSGEIVAKILSGDSLADKDYDEMLSCLDDMFNIVSLKAQAIIDSGYKRKDVRIRLAFDSVYQRISDDALIIDSVLLDYMASTEANPKVRVRYLEIAKNAAYKSSRLGLN